MANANQVAIGRSNLSTGTGYDGANDKYALYLKLFSGEMFKGFQHNTIARDLVMKRTLKNGKSLQFIYTGRMTAAYHTPGTPILGNSDKAPPVAEKTINMDDLLISSAFVYDLDETLAHYELRGEISKKIGYALAEHYDRRIFRAIAKGARKASPVQGNDSTTSMEEPGGTQIRVGSTGTAASDAYDPGHLVNAFYDAAAALDEKGVSSQGRVAVLNPRQYYALINATGSSNGSAVVSTGLVNRDVQGNALQGGQGVIEIAGIKIYKSMNIPFFSNYGTKYGSGSATNPGVTSPGNVGDFVGKAIESADDGNQTDGQYGVASDFSKSCGLIFQKEAAAVVEAIGPQVQTTNGDISVIYQGDVILGRLAMGTDYLNPAACVELFAGATAGNGAIS